MADHITYLRLVSIPVADVDRAKSFYVDTLGFEERFDGPFGEGMRWVELAPPGSQATIALVYRTFEGGKRGKARVLFRWDGETLAAQTAIPPSAVRHAR